MRNLFLTASLIFALAACGSKNTSKAEMTPEQEVQSVDSATTETKSKIEEIGNSVADIQNEVDSILNQ